MRFFWFFVCLAVTPWTTAYAQVKTVITVDRAVYQDVLLFLDGRNPLDIDNFISPHARRDVVDFILIQQAVALGGIELDIQFISGNYDARNVRSVSQGLLLLGLDSFWLSELNKHADTVFISQPLIRCGEYHAGLYASASNEPAMAAQTLDQVQQLSFVSSSDWSSDWQTLTALNPRKLLDEKSWSSQAKLVSRGWVDVMLAPFLPDHQFRFSGAGYDIVAIPGIKLMLQDSRHVAVSRLHPEGEKVFNALEKGLTQLRQQGEIKQAYNQAGFFNHAVDDWLLLNPESKKNCFTVTAAPL